VGDCACIRIRIDAVACDLDFVVLALAIHLRVDAKQVALARIFSAFSSLLVSMSERSPRDDSLRRSSTITLKKSSRSGST
jgi:hypothetical protein